MLSTRLSAPAVWLAVSAITASPASAYAYRSHVRVPLHAARRSPPPRLFSDERGTKAPVQAEPVASTEPVTAQEQRKPWVQRTWEETSAFFSAFQVPKLEEDTMPAAIELSTALNKSKVDPSSVPLGTLANLTFTYYGDAFDRIWESPEVQQRLPSVFAIANGAIVLLILRLLLPRLLAIQSMDDVFEFAPELGLPSRKELLEYMTYAEQMDFGTKLLAFLAIIVVEKVTLIGEFIPVGVILPALSPVLFGGVLQGTIISAACAALGSSVNFLLGRTFLYERARKLEVFGQPPVEETKWYRALSKNIEKNGFKAALLLRLAPVLPIPIDAHWYVCGLTPLKYWEFTSAYFVGALKATFLDAYLGSLLTSAAAGSDPVGESTKLLVVAETLAIILVSVLVTQVALGLFNDMMSEEGFEAVPGSSGQQNSTMDTVDQTANG